MTLLNNLNLTLNELEDMRISQELSWDEIALKVGKSRNTIKSVIIKLFGKLGWDKLAKRESIKDLAQTPDQQTTQPTKTKTTKPKTKSAKKVEEPKQEEVQEPYFKYFMTSLDDNSVIVTVYIDGEKFNKTIKSPALLMKIQEAINTKNFETIKNYLSIEKHLKKVGISYEEVANKYHIAGIELDDGCRNLVTKCYEETVNGTHNSLTGLVAMVHNLNKARKLHVLEQLYGFLKHNDIEILEDGSFIGYKYLYKNDKGEYLDDYTKTIKQGVGDYIYTYEEKVNNNPNEVCSYGLHVAAWKYLNTRFNIAKVRVLAEDVVSVPTDYDGSKLRCKGYTILEIRDNKPTLQSFTPTNKLNLQPKNNVYVDATK